MKPINLLLSMILLLSACTSNTVPQNQDSYNATEQARIRLYGQNQKPTIMYYQHNDKKMKINVGGGLGDAFGSFVGVAKNHSIGIPETEISINLKKQNGLLSKAFYKEFIIPANTPITVQNSFIGLTNINQTPTATNITYSPSCNSKKFIFTAKAGHDYEVASMINNQGCSVTVFEINQNGQLKVIK